MLGTDLGSSIEDFILNFISEFALWNISFLRLLTRGWARDRMGENVLTARQGEMSYSAFHYFHFVGVDYLFWLSCR